MFLDRHQDIHKFMYYLKKFIITQIFMKENKLLHKEFQFIYIYIYIYIYPLKYNNISLCFSFV